MAHVFSTFHHNQDPRATNARAELKGTGHTQLSSSRHLICKLTLPNLHKPSNLPNLHKTLQPSQYFSPYFILHLELFCELLLTHSLFIPFGVKPCLLLLLYINFVARKSRSSSFLQELSPSLYCCLSTVYSFTKRRIKLGFSGLI